MLDKKEIEYALTSHDAYIHEVLSDGLIVMAKDLREAASVVGRLGYVGSALISVDGTWLAFNEEIAIFIPCNAEKDWSKR